MLIRIFTASFVLRTLQTILPWLENNLGNVAEAMELAKLAKSLLFALEFDSEAFSRAIWETGQRPTLQPLPAFPSSHTLHWRKPDPQGVLLQHQLSLPDRCIGCLWHCRTSSTAQHKDYQSGWRSVY